MHLEPTVPPAPSKKLGRLIAVLVLACFFVAFFWHALARYSEVYYSPADISQTHYLTRVEKIQRPGNELLSDLVVQMEPWLHYNKQELAAGRIALWNPYNGGGTPHLANGQAAVFSPFSLPYYLFSFRAALIVSAALKLLISGVFTYLFLRRLGLFVLPSILGGVAFAFCGHNVLLLGYPHPAAAAALPAGVFFVERTFQKFEATGRHSPSSLVGLCLSMALGLVAGQPEPCFFALYLIGLYAIARALRAWRKKGGTLRLAMTLLPYVLEVGVAAAIAAGLGAFKIVPFLEYLQNSHLLDQRTGTQTPLIGFTWPLHFFPNLLGNPSQDHYLSPTIPPPNFETANLAYISGFVIFLALFSLAFVRKNRTHAFFALIALLWVIYAHDLLGAWKVFAWLPGLSLAPVNRSQPIWLFAVACCAAFAVQRMLESDRKRYGIALATAAFACAAWFVVRREADGLIERAVEYAAKLENGPGLVASDVKLQARAHVAEMSVLFGCGAAALAVGWIAPRGIVRHALALGIVAVGYLGTGNLLKHYNPVCENRFFFPVTPAIETLKQTIGDERLVIFGDDTIPPDTNMVYGISLISSYDGLWVRRYDRLYREIFGEHTNWRNPIRGTGKGMKLFGAEWVLSMNEWTPFDTEFRAAPERPREFYPVGEIKRGSELLQEFTLTRNGLQAIRFFATAENGAVGSALSWTLEDAATHEVLASGVEECSRIALSRDERKSIILMVPAIERLRGRTLRLYLRAPDATDGNALTVWARRDAPPIVNEMLWRDTRVRELRPEAPIDPNERHPDLDKWAGTLGNRAIDGGLWIDLSYGFYQLARRTSIGPFDLFRYTKAAGKWHVVSNAVAVASEEEAWARTLHPGIDPAGTVILEGVEEEEERASAKRAAEATRIEVELDLAQSKRLKFTRKEPGWLVLTQPWYPGWRARVNGSEREIVRANYAFGAVKVDAGENVVELSFEPQSFYVGASITLASVLTGAGLILLLVRRQARAKLPASAA